MATVQSGQWQRSDLTKSQKRHTIVSHTKSKTEGQTEKTDANENTKSKQPAEVRRTAAGVVDYCSNVRWTLKESTDEYPTNTRSKPPTALLLFSNFA